MALSDDKFNVCFSRYNEVEASVGLKAVSISFSMNWRLMLFAHISTHLRVDL